MSRWTTSGGGERTGWTRRPAAWASSDAGPLRFGLPPIFLDSGIRLLVVLECYLSARLERPVQLTKRRTYQETATLPVTGQLDAGGQPAESLTSAGRAQEPPPACAPHIPRPGPVLQ